MQGDENGRRQTNSGNQLDCSTCQLRSICGIQPPSPPAQFIKDLPPASHKWHPTPQNQLPNLPQMASNLPHPPPTPPPHPEIPLISPKPSAASSSGHRSPGLAGRDLLAPGLQEVQGGGEFLGVASPWWLCRRGRCSFKRKWGCGGNPPAQKKKGF